MNVNRRTFIKSSSILMGGLFLQGNEIFDLSENSANNIKELTNNIGIYNEKGGTIGWYVQDDTVILIDSQFPDTAKNFYKELKTKTDRKINYLFNTHHHGDHTLGNFYLKDFTENIVAQTNCPRLQVKQNKGKKTENQVVIANIVFDSELKFKLPKENLTAMYFGQAHTGGDIIIHFENNNIAHLGDLVFNNVYPYIDNNGECSVKNWILVLDKVLNYFDSDTKFIFGHADNTENVIGNKKDIENKKDYLDALYSYVSGQAAKGKTIEEIENSNTIPGFDNIKELWKGARKMNLKATAEQII